jgi:hypothetical protein
MLPAPHLLAQNFHHQETTKQQLDKYLSLCQLSARSCTSFWLDSAATAEEQCCYLSCYCLGPAPPYQLSLLRTSATVWATTAEYLCHFLNCYYSGPAQLSLLLLLRPEPLSQLLFLRLEPLSQLLPLRTRSLSHLSLLRTSAYISCYCLEPVP